MKRTVSLLCFGVLVMSLTGCNMVMKPFEKPVFVEIGTSHSAYAVPMSGDTTKQKSFQSKEFLNKHMIATKRIRIPRTWVQTGRKWLLGIGPYTGYYQPQVRVIKVDRAPVTVQWSRRKNNAIWVESRDSVGFSTGISLTARIANNLDATTFLYNYPPSPIETQENDAEVSVSSLREVLNEEVRARVQKIFSEEAAVENMDELRSKKKEIIHAIENDIVPFFANRGITITTVGQFGGFEYENTKIQEAIDKVFQAQQDKEVAIAEAEAAGERKEALRLKGEGKAAESIEIAKGEAESITLKADAKAYEATKLAESEEFYLKLKDIEVQLEWLEAWDGKLPEFLMSGQGGSNLLLQVPMPKQSSK